MIDEVIARNQKLRIAAARSFDDGNYERLNEIIDRVVAEVVEHAEGVAGKVDGEQ